MKKILVLIFMLLSMNLEAAEPITGSQLEQPKPTVPQGFTYIGETADGKFSWYFLAKTFKVYDEGFSILTVRKTNESGEATRMFLGVETEHCKLGFGSLKARESLDQPWQNIFNFSAGTKETVADVISNLICDVGLSIIKNEKPPIKKGQLSI